MDEAGVHQYEHDLRLAPSQIRKLRKEDFQMRRCVLVLTGLIALSSPAWSADYDKTETSPLYQLRLRVPAAGMAIPALRDKIMALYKVDADETKSDAKDDKDADPEFHPFNVETTWRITFENDALISLSSDIFADTGGAHPNGAFETLVWDKKADRALAITDLFAPQATKAALAAISNAAAQTWNAIYQKRSGQKSPVPDADHQAKDGIGPDTRETENLRADFRKGAEPCEWHRVALWRGPGLAACSG